MTMTIDSAASGGTAYLPASELLKRVDVRWFQDMLSDSGSRVAADNVATNVNLLAILDDVFGEFEAAVTLGKRYTKADLALLAASATVARARMYRLLSDLVVLRVWQRRPDKGPIPDRVKKVEEELRRIQDGYALLGTPTEHQEAGLVQSRVETPQQVRERNGAVTQAGRFFGRRGDGGS